MHKNFFSSRIAIVALPYYFQIITIHIQKLQIVSRLFKSKKAKPKGTIGIGIKTKTERGSRLVHLSVYLILTATTHRR
jgi:hypothetical protein